MSSSKTGSDKKLGFWQCWALTVGIMIGSGVFLLPAALAPYGMISFGGWAITATGSVFLSLVIARLAKRTKRSGGVYAYAYDAFGSLTGFLVGWGYWAAYWIAIPAMAIAFAGYLGVFIPALKTDPSYEAGAAGALIWLLTIVNLRGIKEASTAQLLMTVLKLIPLGLIVCLASLSGSTENLPSMNPTHEPVLPLLATTALLTMWAFSGLEAGTVPANDIDEPEKTIPKAIIIGTLTVAFVYITSTFAVMLLVPAEQLVNSTAPFADAAAGLGAWGPYFVAIGALISIAGAINGTIFVLGQIPMAIALDKQLPSAFAKRNSGGSSNLSLLMAATLSTIMLMMNYSKGLIQMFEFLATMSTLAILLPLLISALAEFKYSLKSAKAWAGVAGFGMLYSLFAILGSGFEVIAWGVVLLMAGLPVYFWGRPKPETMSQRSTSGRH